MVLAKVPSLAEVSLTSNRMQCNLSTVAVVEDLDQGSKIATSTRRKAIMASRTMSKKRMTMETRWLIRHFLRRRIHAEWTMKSNR